MCFSATASFTSAAVIGAIGLLTLSKVRNRKMLPFAVIPLVFALQQSIEGIIWLTHHRPDLAYIQIACIYSFLAIANIFWPFWCPYSVYIPEKNTKRKKAILFTWTIGCMVSLTSIYSLIAYGAETKISCDHIAYQAISNFFNQTDPYFIPKICALAGYSIATIVPFFLSSVPRMWFFGLAVGIGWVIAQIFYAYSFGSIWCFFAAISSILIYIIVITKGR